MNGSEGHLSFPDNVAQADVYVTNSGSNIAGANVAASNGGSIAITARNIDIAGGSILRGGLKTGLGFPGAEAGDIELSAQRAIAIANSFILTWNQLLKVKDFDNLLRLSDSSGSSTIELLVLSACQTAQGDKRAALGLAGVAVRAGARSTLATLWSVDDESVTELMSQFYRELKTGVTRAKALQHGQLAVLNNEKRPYFWAPYVLVGNWL